MKDEFLRAFATITRPGADRLLVYLEECGFFEDPASARHHLNIPGGLCQHSLNVYRRLSWLCEAEMVRNPNFHPNVESIAIVSLLHDLCKAGTYRMEAKNRKCYDADKVKAAGRNVKHDSVGDFVWESTVGYANDDPFPFGHGEKSVFLIQRFMELSDEEALAIRYHMGSWNDGEKGNASSAYKMNELAMLLHMADEFATFVDEE